MDHGSSRSCRAHPELPRNHAGHGDELVSDGKEHALQEVIAELADRFSLSGDERSEMLPSGFQATFTNRVAWAATHLNKAGALKRVGRGRDADHLIEVDSLLCVR